MPDGRTSFAVFAALILAGCPEGEPANGELPMTRALLELADEAHRDLSLEAIPRHRTLLALGQLAKRARRELDLPSRGSGRRSAALVGRLNRLIFDLAGFRREVKDQSPQLMLLPRVLEGRRGSCLGLAALYLAVGEQLGVALRGVVVPGHFFLRYESAGQRRDVELLKRGGQMPLSWYRSKYGVPANNALYLRSLSCKESLAVFRYNLANEHRLRGGYARAEAIYQQVVRQLPDFAEAHANLGLTYQLQGKAEAAAAAYARAGRANPNLREELRRNLQQLP